WTTFDPTPPDPNPPSMSLATRLQLYLDAMQVFWQNWVLSYDSERQFTLAAQVEQSGRNVQLRWLEGALDRLMRTLRIGSQPLKEQGWKAVVAVCVLVIVVIATPWILEKLRGLARVRR